MSEPRARVVEDAGGLSVWFYCPGCETHHRIVTAGAGAPRRGWTWNGRIDFPTFAPSVLVKGENLTTEARAMIERGDPPADGVKYSTVPFVCHSFVENGRIRYLADSTHRHAGQTIDLPPIADSMGADLS